MDRGRAPAHFAHPSTGAGPNTTTNTTATASTEPTQTDKSAQEFLKSKGFDPEVLSSDPKTVDLTTRQNQIGTPSVSSPASSPSPLPPHSPQDYFRSYAQFAEWVDRSLDIYHPELHVILWPLFVHTFIGIVSQSGQSSAHQGYSREGKQFLDKFSPAFLDSTPREGGEGEGNAYGEYVQEIRHFYSLSSKELLDLSNTIKCYRTYRYNVSLSRETFQLLVLFLQESGLVLMSSIFNAHVHVRIIARLPQEIDVEQILGGGDRGGLTGISKGAEEEMMKKEVWGASSRSDGAVFTALNDVRDRVAATSKSLPSICFFTLLNSHETMASADFSADLKSIAVATTENTVRVYNIGQDSIKNGPLEKCNILRGHSGAVTGVSYSPCRRFLLSSSVDTTARLWSLETRQNLATYKFHSFPVWDVQFSPGGYFFATASHDRTALLWSTDSSSPRRVFAGHLSDVETMQFYPNCNYLATGSADKTVRLWDINTGDCLRLFSGHLGGIHTIAFSPNGKMIAAAGEDHRILVWDIGTGKRVATLRGHLSDVWTLAFDGPLLASGGADYTVRLWDINAASSASSSSAPPPSSAPSASPSPSSSSRRKGESTPSYLLASFPTKKTPVLKLKFRRNLLLGCGPFSV